MVKKYMGKSLKCINRFSFDAVASDDSLKGQRLVFALPSRFLKKYTSDFFFIVCACIHTHTQTYVRICILGIQHGLVSDQLLCYSYLLTRIQSLIDQ